MTAPWGDPDFDVVADLSKFVQGLQVGGRTVEIKEALWLYGWCGRPTCRLHYRHRENICKLVLGNSSATRN